MRALSVLVLLAAVLAFTVVRAEDDVPLEAEAPTEKGVPFVIVSKTVGNKMVVKGGAVEVSVVVFNYGSAAAYNVKITDDVTEGEAKTKSVDVLEPLENITLTYTVTPTKYGGFEVPVAVVTYTLEASASAQLFAYSNQVLEENFVFQGEDVDDLSGRGQVFVATNDEYDRANTKYVKESIAYLVLAGILILFPYYTFRTKQDQVDYLIRMSRKK